MIFITVKNCVIVLERKCYIDCGTVPRVLQKPAPTVEISANSLTTHIKLKHFRSFYKFYWTSKLYATLIMGNRFLRVLISIIWVVFTVKTVTLLWQPANAQDIARECHSSGFMQTFVAETYFIFIMITKGPQLDLETNILLLADTWVVEAVYRHKN